jgi:hypothetical protein
VLAHYQERGLPEHARALEAYEVLAESWLTLHLWELWPDKNNWVRAEDQLRQLRDGYRDSHGADNLLTLAASAQHADALVALGRQEAADELVPLRPALARRLGERHPLHLRALYLTALLHARKDEYGPARQLFEQALAGQRAVLGTRHKHTLQTQYELAVVLKLGGDAGWQPLMTEVAQLAPAAIGRGNDLYAQALIAGQLLRMPAGLVRRIVRFGRPTG